MKSLFGTVHNNNSNQSKLLEFEETKRHTQPSDIGEEVESYKKKFILDHSSKYNRSINIDSQIIHDTLAIMSVFCIRNFSQVWNPEVLKLMRKTPRLQIG